MNDVLPKPFTKEGLLNMLEKYLSHLKGEKDSRIPPQPGFLDRNNGIIQGHRNAITRGGTKYSQSPSKSPRDSGIYGRAPVNPAENAVRQTPPPIGDENAYVNLLGGLLNDSVPPRNTASIFSSPGSSSVGVRRPASEMDDNQHFTGIDAKKPRY
jgi:osomolarity two-component system response regulator SKN7